MRHLLLTLMAVGLLSWHMPCYANEGDSSYSVATNSVTIETNFFFNTSIIYDRFFPLDRTTLYVGAGYVLGSGFAKGYHWVQWEAGALLGGPKYFIDVGAVMVGPFYDNRDGNFEQTADASPGAKIGYKIQSPSGLVFKVNINVLPSVGPVLFPAMGVGYAF